MTLVDGYIVLKQSGISTLSLLWKAGGVGFVTEDK